MSRPQSGVGMLVMLLAVGLLAAVGFFSWQTTWVRDENPSVNQGQFEGQDDRAMTTPAEDSHELSWQQTADGWRPMGSQSTSCPLSPMLQAPADLSRATAILYPGQTRGGNYKPHGGFRFDNAPTNQVTVVAPMDGFIVRGGHYLAEGEVQYTFDIMNNCGVMYRVGHLRMLPVNLQQLTERWPKAVEGDSRTQSVEPPVFVRQGEMLATAVGILGSRNTFFDLGVYDYRQTNAASKSPSYQSAHMQDKELSWHALCWFDLLPPDAAARVRSLPAGDPTSGTKSDYCI